MTATAPIVALICAGAADGLAPPSWVGMAIAIAYGALPIAAGSWDARNGVLANALPWVAVVAFFAWIGTERMPHAAPEFLAAMIVALPAVGWLLAWLYGRPRRGRRQAPPEA